MNIRRKVASIGIVVAVLSAAGIAGATINQAIITRGAGEDAGVVRCPGGMTRLGHDFNEDISLFPGDPVVDLDTVYTVADDFFKVEQIHTGAHAGTHLDVPGHFIEGGATLDDLDAEDFVWPAYKIDVRGMTFANNQVEKADIRAYEREHGRIKPGSLVILQTGAEEFFGLGGPNDHAGTADATRTLEDGTVQTILDEHGQPFVVSNNEDDLFEFENAGFSGAAVAWMFEKRAIDGVGSDAYGPDAATDELFDATFTTLDLGGVALVAIANLDSVSVRGDVIMAPTVSLSDGSGFSTDPIACHAEQDDDDDDKD